MITAIAPNRLRFQRLHLVLCILIGTALAAAVPGARLHLIQGGHMIPITQADVIAPLIASAAGK